MKKENNILGLTAPISENTSACIFKSGELIAFSEDERFVGIKHAPRMVPQKAIKYCLEQANLSIDDINYIAIGYNNAFKGLYKNVVSNLKERNFYRGVRKLGAYLEYFLKSIGLKEYLISLSKKEKNQILKKIVYVSHHMAHAASTARCPGFEESIIISIDGVGANEAGLLGYFKDNKIIKLKSIPINQSLGWFYGTVTQICGFKIHKEVHWFL